MFYFFAKRRQDINAAEDRGRVEGHVEGRAEGRMEGRVEGRAEGRMEGRAEGRQEIRAAINAVAARFDREPNATPVEVIQALRDELTADRVR